LLRFFAPARSQGLFFVHLLDAVRFNRHPLPKEVVELELMALYHCGPWDLERVSATRAARDLFVSRMLRKIAGM